MERSGLTTTPPATSAEVSITTRSKARLPLGLFALYLGIAAPFAVATAVTRLRDGVPHLGEDPATARRRVFGTPYTEAIEGIRRALPAGNAYVIVNMDEEDDGLPLWVRYDLAPRRAIYLGRLSQLPPNLKRVLPRQPLVLTYGSQLPPQLITRRDFLDWFEAPDHGRRPPRDDAPAGPR